jgi:hypothetical protein
VTIGMDDSCIAVVVKDQYGTLTPDTIVQNLSRCYQASQASVQHRVGGAGIGLFMLLQGSTRLVFNIAPGKFTEMIFLRNYKLARKKFADTAPTLNICVVKQ